MLATWEKTQNKQAREQVHLHVKTGRFVGKKKTRSLPASPLSNGKGTERETAKMVF